MIFMICIYIQIYNIISNFKYIINKVICIRKNSIILLYIPQMTIYNWSKIFYPLLFVNPETIISGLTGVNNQFAEAVHTGERFNINFDIFTVERLEGQLSVPVSFNPCNNPDNIEFCAFESCICFGNEAVNDAQKEANVNRAMRNPNRHVKMNNFHRNYSKLLAQVRKASSSNGNVKRANKSNNHLYPHDQAITYTEVDRSSPIEIFYPVNGATKDIKVGRENYSSDYIYEVAGGELTQKLDDAQKYLLNAINDLRYVLDSGDYENLADDCEEMVDYIRSHDIDLLKRVHQVYELMSVSTALEHKLYDNISPKTFDLYMSVCDLSDALSEVLGNWCGDLDGDMDVNDVPNDLSLEYEEEIINVQNIVNTELLLTHMRLQNQEASLVEAGNFVNSAFDGFRETLLQGVRDAKQNVKNIQLSELSVASNIINYIITNLDVKLLNNGFSFNVSMVNELVNYAQEIRNSAHNEFEDIDKLSILQINGYEDQGITDHLVAARRCILNGLEKLEAFLVDLRGYENEHDVDRMAINIIQLVDEFVLAAYDISSRVPIETVSLLATKVNTSVFGEVASLTFSDDYPALARDFVKSQLETAVYILSSYRAPEINSILKELGLEEQSSRFMDALRERMSYLNY